MTTCSNPLNGLPDPGRQAAFYQGVPLKRAIAWVIDGVFVFILTLLASLMTLGLGFFVFFGLWAVLSFLYRVGTLTMGSATWGMRLMAIELRRGDGMRFDGATAVLHTVGTFLCFATSVQIVSVILMLFTSRGQGLPDLILGTTAVNQMARF
ncbi:MAG: RDD family protein [Pseudomonadota bacterium]